MESKERVTFTLVVPKRVYKVWKETHNDSEVLIDMEGGDEEKLRYHKLASPPKSRTFTRKNFNSPGEDYFVAEYSFEYTVDRGHAVRKEDGTYDHTTKDYQIWHLWHLYIFCREKLTKHGLDFYDMDVIPSNITDDSEMFMPADTIATLKILKYINENKNVYVV